MLRQMINKILGVFKGRELFKYQKIKVFAVLFVLGIGLSLAIASCAPKLDS
ncbi:hypothetical protein NIES2109_04410 [Nostoc sp. HK-01]|nr:hypothetical protein NIES2109_04410 [Nostoc sp. HK-01]